MRGIYTIGLFVGASCASGPALDRAALPDIERYADEPGIVLSSSYVVELDLGDDGLVSRSTFRSRQLITSAQGRRWGDLRTSYDADFGSIERIRVTVHRPDGQTVRYDESDAEDVPAFSRSSVFENSRAVYLEVPDLPAGAVVDREIVRRRTKAELFVERNGFGGRVPVLEERFEVRAPEGWELRHRAYQAGRTIEFPPDFEGIEDGRVVLRWLRRDLAPIEWEPRAPPVSDLRPYVAVRVARWIDGGALVDGMRSMADYARFMSTLQAGTADPNPEIEAIVNEVLADAPPDPYEKAARLYGWVQENIRYVSIQVGIGGWRPYPATEVVRNRFGDCKDKATLLKSMLAVAGIESRLATLYAHDGIPRDFVLPGLGLTNHAILAIELPNERVIVDPTSRTVPFGQLPLSDQGAPLLLVGETEDPVIRAPTSTPAENRRSTRLRVTPDGRGNWSGTATIEARGGIASELHRRLLGQSDDMPDHIASYANVLDSHATNARWAIHDDRLEASVDVEFRQVGSKVEDRLLVRPSDFLAVRWNDLKSGERKTPVLIRMRREVDEHVDLDLQGGRVLELPEPVELESDFARYWLRWSATEGGVRIERSARFDKGLIPPEEYGALVDFLDRVKRAESRPGQVVLGSEAR